jgi:hypothetical protein
VIDEALIILNTAIIPDGRARACLRTTPTSAHGTVKVVVAVTP